MEFVSPPMVEHPLLAACARQKLSYLHLRCRWLSEAVSSSRNSHSAFLCSSPDYRYPNRIVNVDPPDPRFPSSALTRWRHRFAHSFSILASRSSDRHEGLHQLTEALQGYLGVNALRCENYLVQKTEAMLFMRSKDGRGFVVRLPYGPCEALRDRNNANALRLLRAKQPDLSGVSVPELLFEGMIERDYVTVETMLQGTDLRKTMSMERLRAAVEPLSHFLINFGKAAGSSPDERDAMSETADAVHEVARHLLDEGLRVEFQALAGVLLKGLECAHFKRARTHGDFNIKNCLWDPTSNRLVGVVDWDEMNEQGVAGGDLLALLCSMRKRTSRVGWGRTLADIGANGLTDEEGEAWTSYMSAVNGARDRLAISCR